MTATNSIRLLRENAPLSPDAVFDAIAAAGAALTESDREADDALEIAIRLLEARRRHLLPDGAETPVEYLAEECGLYPYVDASQFGLITQSIIESHSVALHEKLYLHSKQMQVLLWLLGGDNVILSAPTRFGKSVLVDAFLSRAKPQTVVMILPTIALIDECRRRLIRNFGKSDQIVTTSSEIYDHDQRVIFVLTQERFLQRKDVGLIDFLFIDEFYKLDPARTDGRFETLNLALYKALPRSAQCFMAGPHIRTIELGARWSGNFRFVKTDYRTVTVNLIDRSNRAERLHAFLEDLRSVGDESSLVFTAAPGSAENLMSDIIDAGIRFPTADAASLGSWIRRNYHEDWLVAQGCELGLGIHHGRLPRSLAQLFVSLFDSRQIKILICTSTLIEGVNTAARNVFIYDKKINRTDFDFFSFANIRGRVGRMMRHFVGNVYLYHEPPTAVATDVRVPILSEPGDSTDYLVMNVEADDLSVGGRARQGELPLASGLSEEILREHGALGVDLLVTLRQQIAEALAKDPSTLLWSGFPDRSQRIAVAELLLTVTHTRGERAGINTAPQLAWAWAQLAQIRSLGGFLRWFARTFSRVGLDGAFQFLQACEFGFPRSLAAVEALVNYEVPNESVSYAAYIAAMENWFRPQWMKQLDEAGIPIPLGERLRRHVGDVETRAEAIGRIVALNWDELANLDAVDRLILQRAFEGA